VIKSMESKKCAERGHMAGARENGASAKKWAIISMVTAVALAIVVPIIYFIFIAVAVSSAVDDWDTQISSCVGAAPVIAAVIVLVGFCLWIARKWRNQSGRRVQVLIVEKTKMGRGGRATFAKAPCALHGTIAHIILVIANFSILTLSGAT
jgi:hypothetical protein